jgi:hypothetical protein
MEKIMSAQATSNIGFRLKSSTTIPLTQEELDRFRALPASPTERALSQKRLTMLKEKIEAGKAIPFGWASAELDGQEIRCNGQHSSEVLSQMNGTLPDNLIIHRDVYSVDTTDGLINLFRQFDDRVSGRTPLDVAGAYAKMEPGLAGVSMPIAKMAAESIVFYDTAIVGGSKVIGDDCYQVLHEQATHDFINWLDGSVFSTKTRELAYKPIIAAMWATWQANVAETKVFWDLVARGGVVGDDSHAASMLDAALEAMKDKKVERPQPKALYYGCIFAWNAYRAGNKPKSIKFDARKGHVEPVE